jgi:hypothetical protein
MTTERDRSGPKTLADLLAGAEGGRKPRVEPSELRRHIRDNFATIEEARGREVPWRTIAGAMAELGVKAPDGGTPAWQTVKAMFYAERAARGGKPKRKAKRAAPARRATPASPKPTAPPAEPVPEPARPALTNPYAELEARQAEAKRRRERAQEAKEWNPYAPKKDDQDG